MYHGVGELSAMTVCVFFFCHSVNGKKFKVVELLRRLSAVEKALSSTLMTSSDISCFEVVYIWSAELTIAVQNLRHCQGMISKIQPI